MEITPENIGVFVLINVAFLIFLYFFIGAIYRLTRRKKDPRGSRSSDLSENKKEKIQAHIQAALREEIKKRTEAIKKEIRREYEKKLEEKDQKIVVLNQKYGEVQENNKKLVVEKKKTENVIHSISAGVIVVNDKGETIMMNPAAEKIIGKKQTEVLGKPVIRTQGEGQLISLADSDDENKVILSEEDENTKKILKSSSAVIENEKGQTVGMVSVISDVTKQKELEETKARFVASVSHELRTPLTAIQRSLEIIVDGQLGDVSEKQKEFLGLSLTSIQRLRSLVNDILDFSKLDANSMALEYETFRVGILIDEVRKVFEVLAKDKDVKLVANVEDEMLRIDGDSNRLMQVLTNLIANGLKFTPAQGKITIKVIAIKNEEGDVHKVRFEVTDTGRGISKEEQTKIFDHFAQGTQPVEEKYRGTGLGLSIAKQIVELHGGEIGVTSTLGKGSTFFFQIPRQQGIEPQ